MRVVATGFDPLPASQIANADDHRLKMTERQLQTAICDMADKLGWCWYHTYDSRRSKEGFPDLVMWQPHKHRTLYAELKSQVGPLTRQQARVLQQLADTGNHVHLWRPSDWITGIIETELKRR